MANETIAYRQKHAEAQAKRILASAEKFALTSPEHALALCLVADRWIALAATS